MPPLIVGSTLSDLGRNSLLAAQQEQDARNATAQLLYNQMLAAQQDRQANQDRNLRRDSMNQDASYRNALLQEQARQWNTPNATSMESFRANAAIAARPYNEMTAAQQADASYRNGLLQMQREQLELQRKMAEASMQPSGPLGVPPAFGNSKAGQMMVEDALAQRASAERRQRALDTANAQLASELDAFTPFTTDAGVAREVLQNLSGAIPEAGELVYDRATKRFIIPGAGQPPTLPANVFAQPKTVSTNIPQLNIGGFKLTPVQ